MATIERGHSGWMLSFHTTTGQTHSAYGDLDAGARQQLGDAVSQAFHDLMALWQQIAADRLADEAKHTEPGRPLQDRAAP